MKRVLKWLSVLLLMALVAGGLTFYFRPLLVSALVTRFHLWRAGVRSEYVVVGGHRLHYFEAGEAHGKALVLIHGLGSKGEDWAPLIPRLAADGFHVYVSDLLGYGRSDQPDVSYSMSVEEKAIVGFMDAMHIEKADVGGWSMGGWVAMSWRSKILRGSIAWSCMTVREPTSRRPNRISLRLRTRLV